MIAFLKRWALYSLLVPITLAAAFVALSLGVVAVVNLHEKFGGWFWLAALLTLTAALAADGGKSA